MKSLRLLPICMIAMLFTVRLLGQKHATQGIPLPYTSPVSGREMFHSYCADCHGLDGKGNGPVAAVLRIMPPDLTTLVQRNQGSFPYDRVFKIISGDATITSHGDREMPVWGRVFRQMDKRHRGEAKLRIKTLTNYVASLQAQTK